MKRAASDRLPQRSSRAMAGPGFFPDDPMDEMRAGDFKQRARSANGGPETPLWSSRDGGTALAPGIAASAWASDRVGARMGEAPE